MSVKRTMQVPINVRSAEIEVLSAVEAWRTARDNAGEAIHSDRNVEEAELRLCRADNALIQARSKTRV
jgi:hypothetical protein